VTGATNRLFPHLLRQQVMAELLLIHGLTYDHRTWELLRRHLDPSHRLLAVDLPGHGGRPPQDAYPLDDVIADVHDQAVGAGYGEPVVVGHSAGAIIAHAYAARFPASAVVNVDQMVLPGPFFGAVRAAEPQLRGPDWRGFWDRMLAGMGIDSLPAEARDIVENATAPRPDLLLGYWDEILRNSDEQIRAYREQELRAIADKGLDYQWLNAVEPPAPYLRWLRSILPRAEVTIVPGSHFPHLSDPASVAAVLNRF
jgi:pimeloyl-ACP methyl ester carboxylesterase